MIPLRCPLCRTPLSPDGGSLLCGRGHRFDLSADGYVNLAVGKSGSGDDAAMCRARRDFLAAGYYDHPASLLAGIAAETIGSPDALICDAGCGEGHYLRAIRRRLPDCRLIGFDLAKDSIRFAARAERRAENPVFYAVSGIFSLPLPDDCCKLLLSVFAPVPHAEAHRVLDKGGRMLVVHPGARHLFGLKERLYADPYENEEKPLSFPGFRPLSSTRCRYTVSVAGRDMSSLLGMTPYFWRTPKEDIGRFLALDGLETELDFLLSVFEAV